MESIKANIPMQVSKERKCEVRIEFSPYRPVQS